MQFEIFRANYESYQIKIVNRNVAAFSRNKDGIDTKGSF